MDRNTITGILVMLGFVVAWAYFFGPEKVEDTDQNKPKTEQTSENDAKAETDREPTTTNDTAVISTEPTDQNAIGTDSLAAARTSQLNREKFGVLASGATGDAELITLQNEVLELKINTKGGLFEDATLRDGSINFWDSLPVRLWDPEFSNMEFALNAAGTGIVKTSDLYFTPTLENKGDSAQVLRMRMNGATDSKYLEFVYTMPSNGYAVEFDMNVVGLNQALDFDDSPAKLNWKARGYTREKSKKQEMQRSSVFYREMGEDRDYLRETSDEDEEILEEKLNWMTFKQNFFSAMVISDEGFQKGSFIKNENVAEDDSLHLKDYTANLIMPANNNGADLTFYFGPNEYENLMALEVEEADRIIDYGWGIFGWVNTYFIRPMYNFFAGLGIGPGWIILFITIIIKLILFPITWKNYLSSAKMRVLRPEIEELNKKYEGKDAVEKQQATMALYRQTGVSPLAGCIPALLQMPILYAMFRFFPASIALRQKEFLWADDLTGYDAIISWTGDFGIISDFYGNHVSLFTVLMAISTFFYTRMSSANMPTNNQPGMPNMKVIMNIFPLFMLIFFNTFAAGLSFYYFLANTISIGQMWAIKKYFINEDKIREKIETNKKKPKKTSAFQQRLKEAQKLQQQRQAQQKKKK